MPPTYCELDAALDNARDDVLQAGKRYTQANQAATMSDDLLQNLPATYAAVVTEINAQAAANPGEVIWQTTLGRKNEIVAERADLIAKTEAIVACFQSITDHGAAAVQAAVDAL